MAGIRHHGIRRLRAASAASLMLAFIFAAAPALALPRTPDFQLLPESRTGESEWATSDTTPRIGGRTGSQAKVLLEVRLYESDTSPILSRETVADDDGNFEFQLPELADGTYDFTVTAFKGGQSLAMRGIEVDTVAPTGTYLFALGEDLQTPAPTSLATRDRLVVLSFRFRKDGEGFFGVYREDGTKVDVRWIRKGNVEILLPENETHTYRIINIDDAGNVGPQSEPVTISQKTQRNAIDTADVEALRKSEGITIENAPYNRLDFLGQSAAGLGDINRDGYDDVAISSAAGESGGTVVVVYGAPRKRLPSVVDVRDLDGQNGFRVVAADAADLRVGRSVGGGGDVDRDGFDDIVIANGFHSTVWVLYGRETFPALVRYDEKKPDKRASLRVRGPRAPEHSEFGRSVAIVGDINDDGVDDFAVGDTDGGAAGFAYVIFGRDDGTFPAEMSVLDLDGRNGFRLDGVKKGDGAGALVAAAGDFNADGIDDMLVGAPSARPGGRKNAGIVYVLFGRKGEFPKRLDLGSLDGRTGFSIPGPLAGDNLGRGSGSSGKSSAAAGDVNGDGIDDLVLTAAVSSGSTLARTGFVVFGARKKSFAKALDLKSLNGRNGFRTKTSTTPVAGIGDMNRDGFDDVMFMGDAEPQSGYILLGQTSFPKLVEFDKTNGVSVVRVSNLPGSGTVAPAGDVDRDGRADLLIGAEDMVVSTLSGPGGGYVLFGQEWK